MSNALKGALRTGAELLSVEMLMFADIGLAIENAELADVSVVLVSFKGYWKSRDPEG